MQTATTDGGPRSDAISNHSATTSKVDRSKAELESLIDQIKQVATAPGVDDASHAGLLSNIRRLQLAVERPLETIYRIGHQVIVKVFSLDHVADSVRVLVLAERFREDCH